MPGHRTAHAITPAQFIRQHLLRMTVSEFAAALQLDSAAVSRYESTTGRIPDAHRRAVKALARQRKVSIDPDWFDSVPFKNGVPA